MAETPTANFLPGNNGNIQYVVFVLLEIIGIEWHLLPDFHTASNKSKCVFSKPIFNYLSAKIDIM